MDTLRTVQVFNAAPHEEKKFSDRVDRVLALSRRELVAKMESSSAALDVREMLHH